MSDGGPATAQSPSIDSGAATAATPRLRNGSLFFALAFGLLYLMMCGIEIYWLNSRTSFENQLVADPGAAVQSQIQNADDQIGGDAMLTLFTSLLAFAFISRWQIAARKTLNAIGQYSGALKASVNRLYWLPWLLMLALPLLVKAIPQNLDTPQGVINYDDKLIVYVVVRAVGGLAIGYFVLLLRRKVVTRLRSR